MGYEIVAIGASLGGVQAVQAILGALPADFSAAVVVVQHRGHSSDDTLAEVLGRASLLPVKEAEDKEPVLPGQVYLAPADYHLLVDDGALALSMDPPVRFARPSIDVLFGAAADAYKERLIGVILTGNGGGWGGGHCPGGCARRACRDPGSEERPGSRLAGSGDRRARRGGHPAAAADQCLSRRDDRQWGPQMNGHDVTSILMVDDRPENLLALEAVLAPLGQNLVQCQSGNEALRRLLSEDFAVIIIDVNMPGMDGFEIASLIRERERSRHTPIIFLTAQADAEHLTRGYSLGAVDYILSPVNPDVLKTKVAVFVELHRRTEAARREADELTRLNAATLALASALSIEQMAQTIADEARRMIRARESLVVVRVEGEWAQEVRAVSMANTDMTGELAQALQSILETGEIDLAIPVRLTDGELRDHSFYRKSLHPLESHVRLRGWLSAPLATREGVLIGFVQLSNKEEGDFDESDERILTRLAQVASNTIDNALHRAVRQANRMKDEFLATLSHELRNPLNAILGWTRLLKTGELDRAATAHALEVIERNVRLQAKLIEDLLDLSRIQTGSVRLDKVPVDLCAVVDGVVESLRPQAVAKQLDLTCEVEGEGLLITGDSDRLAQVSWNLISNAIKFTPASGEIGVRVRRLESSAELSITDTGMGIEPDFLPHVFERFRRGEATGEQSQEGLGLGLAIVRQLVELHGGEVHAESDGRGKGSRFVVRLPLRFVDEAPRPGDPKGTGPGAGSEAISPVHQSTLAQLPRLDGVRILIVDDDRDSRDFLSAALAHQGADVVAAASSGEALDMMNRVGPDVLVSDIAMPGEDGCTLIRKLRARGADNGGEVPAMALTGSVRGKDRDRVLAAGFQAFLPKPVELGDLVATISDLATRERPDTAGSRS